MQPIIVVNFGLIPQRVWGKECQPFRVPCSGIRMDEGAQILQLRR
jgi:hypothetical protein